VSQRKSKSKDKTKSVQVTHSLARIQYLFLGVIVVFFIWSLTQVAHVQDDAFITFRYVKNFVAGNGLVFNIGERVEGYTNFLWAILLSIPALLQVDLVVIAPLLSSLFGILTLFATYGIASRLIESQGETDKEFFNNMLILFPILLLASTGAYAYWTVSGMETTFFIFLVMCALYFYFRNNNSGEVNYYTPASLALAALTRPEGMYFFGVIYLHKLFHELKNEKQSATRVGIIGLLTRDNGIELSIFLVPVLLHLIFRLFYYGYPFPNTFYAKSNTTLAGFSTGVTYAVSFLKSYLLYGAVILVPLIVLRRWLLSFEGSLLCVLIAFHSCYVVIIGGDVLPLHRFWLPILPLLYILFSKSLAELYKVLNTNRRFSPGIIQAIAALFVIGLSFYNYTVNESYIGNLKQKEINLVEQLKNRAEVLNDLQIRQKRKFTVAVSTIGALSYYTDATVIDMLGLTDAYIAHHPETIPEISNDSSNPWKEKKYNSDYVLGRKPDYIVMATIVKPSSFAERALFTKKEFFNNYYIQFVPIAQDRRYFFYARKSSAQVEISAKKIADAEISPRYVKSYVQLSEYLSDFLVSNTPANFNKLLDTFEKTNELYPSFFPDQYRILADAYYAKDDINTSIIYYSKSVSVDSVNVLGYLGLISCYQVQKNQDKVNECIKKIKQFSLADSGLIEDLR
jgi:arabinofuranosyltransferase